MKKLADEAKQDFSKTNYRVRDSSGSKGYNYKNLEKTWTGTSAGRRDSTGSKNCY